MAATETKNLWDWAGTNAAVIEDGLIAASQGILMPGSPMYLSTSGTWKVCDTADASDAWHGQLIGLVADSSTFPLTAELAANTAIKIARFSTDIIYGICLENNGTDIAEAQTYVGNQYGPTVSTTAGEVGYTSLDVNNSNAVMEVIDIASNREARFYNTTRTPGVALVKILNSVIQTTKA